MNENIYKHVAAYNAANGYGTSEEDVIDTIREGKVVWQGDESPRRWWTDCFVVVDIGGMLIGFAGAITTGDDSPSDKGWEFDPETIGEVVKKEVTTTVYVPAP